MNSISEAGEQKVLRKSRSEIVADKQADAKAKRHSKGPRPGERTDSRGMPLSARSSRSSGSMPNSARSMRSYQTSEPPREPASCSSLVPAASCKVAWGDGDDRASTPQSNDSTATGGDNRSEGSANALTSGRQGSSSRRSSKPTSHIAAAPQPYPAPSVAMSAKLVQPASSGAGDFEAAVAESQRPLSKSVVAISVAPPRAEASPGRSRELESLTVRSM